VIAKHVPTPKGGSGFQQLSGYVLNVTDGGLVSDEAAQVGVPQSTTGAAFLALSLAADRFGARPLVVSGTDALRSQVAQLAGIKGMSVTFADPDLERQRAYKRQTRRQSRGLDLNQNDGAHDLGR
jgi:hypothetical protein